MNWDKVENRAQSNAIQRCRIVMIGGNGIVELKNRKIDLLSRNLYPHEGSLQGTYDRHELKEINRIIEIEEIKSSQT